MQKSNPELLQGAIALIPTEILSKVAFVGGATVHLYLDPKELEKATLRYTEDVDSITVVAGYLEWSKFEEQLRAAGFKNDIDSGINCRFIKNGFIFDFMPTDEATLGFTNRWYQSAYDGAEDIEIASGDKIKLVRLPYFLATKFEAFEGRGDGDYWGSRDIEDILAVIQGRGSVEEEILQSESTVRRAILDGFQKLSDNAQYQNAIEGNFNDPSVQLQVSTKINNILMRGRLLD